MNYFASRRAESIQRAVAEAINELANPEPLITVTGIRLGKSLKSATLFITVLPAEKEADALAFLRRNVRELHDLLHKRVKIGKIDLSFAIDSGEKNRQQLDRLTTE